jgi:hypothetical protein
MIYCQVGAQSGAALGDSSLVLLLWFGDRMRSAYRPQARMRIHGMPFVVRARSAAIPQCVISNGGKMDLASRMPGFTGRGEV